jgi:hypothetical protein
VVASEGEGGGRLPPEARQFVLDSDLVLGAVAGEKGVLVLGRERVAPLGVLPPLRVETLELLNGIRDDQLAQSYQRGHPLATLVTKGKDWAPIYLSAALRTRNWGACSTSPTSC